MCSAQSLKLILTLVESSGICDFFFNILKALEKDFIMKTSPAQFELMVTFMEQ